MSEPELSSTKNPSPAKDPKVLSVTHLNSAIRSLIEGEFPLVWVKGEISNFKPHSSGHFYFNLKDSKSQINAVMFRGFNSHLRFKPQDGQEVVVRGRITVYEPRGNYQIFVEIMEPLGQGALQLAFEQLKQKLQTEGLFAAARKRPLPAMPRRVAIVTSPTGAAIRDMLTVLLRRFKGLDITVFPCNVQGAGAAKEIVAAIQLANKIENFDVMIVGRGGGSIEDLWSFNDEKVARAIFDSKIPVVSAVGHEIDFTIADFVADVRAPTPSAAAEIIVKNASDIAIQVNNKERQLRVVFQKKLQLFKMQLSSYSKRLVDPKRKLMDLSLRCDDLGDRIAQAMRRYLEDVRTKVHFLNEQLGSPALRLEIAHKNVSSFEARLSHAISMDFSQAQGRIRELTSVLDSLSPLRVVGRGYSIVKKIENSDATVTHAAVVKDVSQLKINDKIHIRFAHGEACALIQEIKE